MHATIVTTNEELQQIIQLSHQNLRTKISEEEKTSEGFVSWNYSIELLQKMHTLHPNVIVKDGNIIAGYAMVALKEARHFHPSLEAMIHYLETLTFNNKKLSEYKYYVMGQICIAKAYRGKGVFEMLYQKHKTLFENDYDFVITKISTGNRRSLRAHEKIGFKPIYTYADNMDEWNVVLWDWK
ncbi:MAG TPA: GNAT family N-acetyltransferase [Chitinophagaceae bacterium]|nr:GNAT family N-acetyltransferase [Chitinophagaceae bacterium]